ncbi:DNA cytosine methyltransferase [Nocardia sp. NPDC004711]
MGTLTVVEICAGAGGQALGLEHAGFAHELAIELDPMASATLRANRDWAVITGDVADPEVWKEAQRRKLALPERIDLLAGGVPCPPFSIAGKQLGADDERDLFAWGVEQCAHLRPKALLLENVRGLSMPRFAGYRQHVLDRLGELGYVAEWRLLQASDFGVPQLRPRFVLVALKDEYAPYFSWPDAKPSSRTVGSTLKELIASRGWEEAEAWAEGAHDIAPTIVGGSKKHGGADLGPTRAKKAWAKMGVDAMGVADLPPARGDKFEVGPKLTTEMVSLLQGWDPAWDWKFEGRKTSVYRQIGNAFPPPVAEAVGRSIKKALLKQGKRVDRAVDTAHDPIYRVLREADGFLTLPQISRKIGIQIEPHELEERVSLLSRDFELTVRNGTSATAYKIGQFKAFTGQDDHVRHDLFLRNRAKIS